MPQLSPLEILVVAAVALIVFGPEKLPDIARTVGGAAARMRRMATEFREEFETSLHVDDDDGWDPIDDPAPPGRRPSPPGPAGARPSAGGPASSPGTGGEPGSGEEADPAVGEEGPEGSADRATGPASGGGVAPRPDRPRP